jgi:ferredoxin
MSKNESETDRLSTSRLLADGSGNADNDGEMDDSPVQHLSSDELAQRIDTETDAATQRRLVFVRALYQGEDLETAATVVGANEETGRQWLSQWNDDGVNGFQSRDRQSTSSDAGGTATQLEPDQQATVEYLNYEVLDDHGWKREDDDLFENAAEADLDATDHGTFTVDPDKSILEAAEDQDYVWPYACRGGACANCVAMCEQGEIDMPVNNILPEEAIQEKNARLTCVGTPATTEIKLIYNAKHTDYLDELRLPPQQVNDTEQQESNSWFSSLL